MKSGVYWCGSKRIFKFPTARGWYISGSHDWDVCMSRYNPKDFWPWREHHTDRVSGTIVPHGVWEW